MFRREVTAYPDKSDSTHAISKIMKLTDIIFCSLPVLFIDRLPGAPALLKATVQNYGFSAATADLNLEFFINQAKRNIDDYNQLSSAFNPHDNPTQESSNAFNQWVLDSVEFIRKYNPKIIGLSVFTIFQQRAALALALELRKSLPESKIIMGGYGLTMNSNGLQLSDHIKKFDLLKPFWQLVKEKNLADEVFIGSALEDLVSYLQHTLGVTNKLEKNIEHKKTTLFSTPVPDYTDYKINEYIWTDGPALPITGSRGCVRKCTFCDIPGQFGKFSFRSGEEIANEIITLNKKYNVTTFEFTDSLVNGSLKSFQGWLKIVADYNDNMPIDKKVKWFGQYICRPQTEISSTIYDLIARSGCVNLVIGVESGSNDVLKAMNKKMTVEDVLGELEQFRTHGIQGQLLMLSGFYNETQERFVETLEFIVKLQTYVASGTVSSISVGVPLYINEHMPLYHSAEELGINLDPLDNTNWTVSNDPTNIPTERYYRRLITQLVLDKLGIPISGNAILNLFQIKSRLSKIREQMINA